MLYDIYIYIYYIYIHTGDRDGEIETGRHADR